MAVADFSRNKFRVAHRIARHQRHTDGIVEKMSADRQPNTLAPPQQITKVCSQNHTWKKAIKLQMKCTEKDGDQPYNRMMIGFPLTDNAL